MPNIYLQKLTRPLLLLFFLYLPSFSVEAREMPSTINSLYLIDAPQLQAKPSLVGAIYLTWTPVSDATSYVLEMSNTGLPATFVTLKTFGTSERSFRHTGLYYSQKVYYRLKAVGSSGDEAYSPVISATTHAAGKVFNIMPLGDSNTEGGSGSTDASIKIAYRAKLAQLLNTSHSNGKYDFVGSQRSGSSLATDIDHAGFGGATIQNITDLLRDRSYGGTTNGQGLTYLQEYQPDIVLLHIGTNQVDGSDAAITRLESLLNEIDKYEHSSGKDVTVILAKIIKRVCYDDVFVQSSNCYTPAEAEATLIFNSKMATMAQRRQANGDNLLLVDMQDGAGIIYKWATDGGDMADPLHPTQAGYDKMAPVWFAELDKLLNVQPVSPPDTEAPETTIASKPAALTNQKSATFSFTSNESNVVYLASIDGGAFVEVSNPYTLSNLADGAHTIEVKARDEAGNIDASPATYTWTIDTQAPAAPIVLNPAENAVLNNNKPAISGTAEANAAITLFSGSTQVGTATAGADGNWSITPTTALPEGAQQITAKATDAAGNSSNASSVRSFTIDAKAPETTIATKPAVLTNQTTAQFSFSSNETNVTYEVSLDGGAYTAATSPYNLSNLQDGSHTIAVRATDAAGNIDSTPASYTWTIDTQAPVAPVIASISDDRGPVADDRITADNTLILKGTAEANAKVQLYQGGTAIGEATANSAGNWEFDYTATTLAQGAHTFTASATDAAGNTGPRSTDFAVIIDLTAPGVTIATTQTSPAKAAFEVEITFTEQVYGLALADFSVTNASLSNLTSINTTKYKATVTPSADGAVRVSLAANKVTDLAGNSNTAAEVLEVTYDGTRPQLSISTDAPEIVKEPFTVTFTFSENVDGFEASDVTVANASLSALTAQSGSVYTALVTPASDGEVSIKVAADKAFDSAGNGNVASEEINRIYDVQQPGVVLATAATSPINQPFTVEVKFSEGVKGFELSDLTVTNGTVSQLNKQNDLTYTLLITPAESGEVRVAVAAGKAEDVAGNLNTASNELILTYDASRPAIALSTAAASPVNKPFTVTVKLSEPVTDFSIAALELTNAGASNLKEVNEQEYEVLISPTADGIVKVQLPENRVHDAATNGNTNSNVLEMLYDATAPDKYSVAFTVELVDVTNQSAVGLQVSGAEAGATYFYSVKSENGTEEVTGTATVSTGTFTIPGVDLSGLQDGKLIVSLYLADAAGNKGTAVTDEVEKRTKNIVTVEQPQSIKVPFRTNFDKLPLPEKVNVTYATQERENIKVNWKKGNYNGLEPGVYVLEGILELAPKTYNTENKKASITVEVEPNKAPTGLTLSANAFKPDILPAEVIGTFTTTDPDDTDFTYALVAGAGDADNNMFELLNNNELHLKSNRGLSGKTKFSIRVQSMDLFQNVIIKEFVLTKSPFTKPDIKLVNAFSPDGDGINDTWTVPELRFYNNVEVAVYNRAGEQVFHTLNPEEGWDGKGKDGKVVQGSYFYVIQIKDLGHVQKGVVTVLN
ncbi:Ig-like domain-containing protein [Pontibacter cellulosilyticus]|uniref:Gliding motility-associated C-terminal domain-containing protein n=1 Tax=Pontibacter cellulosilyticus TaxID=1720253 RepID=A0A923N9I3_9BACT|nr:Ig-like domain-containing protein [Pontibacter cellulosilyticus]MBC5994272.1 gliding motility-associated C-terminal domain-containing protein [Pontibacter cellulosilyticus]